MNKKHRSRIRTVGNGQAFLIPQEIIRDIQTIKQSKVTGIEYTINLQNHRINAEILTAKQWKPNPPKKVSTKP